MGHLPRSIGFGGLVVFALAGVWPHGLLQQAVADGSLSPVPHLRHGRPIDDALPSSIGNDAPILLAAQPSELGVDLNEDVFTELPSSQADATVAGDDDGECTPEKQKAAKKAAAQAYRDPFYDNNFGYLDTPCYDGHLLGERFKNLDVERGRHASTLDVGGQYRLRFQDEINMRGLGLTGLDDQFLLRRLRLFANWEVSENLRLYAEYLDASTDAEDFLPRAIEENPTRCRICSLITGSSTVTSANCGRDRSCLFFETGAA